MTIDLDQEIQAMRISPFSYGLGGGGGGAGVDHVRVASLNRTIATKRELEDVDRRLQKLRRRLSVLDTGS